MYDIRHASVQDENGDWEIDNSSLVRIAEKHGIAPEEARTTFLSMVREGREQARHKIDIAAKLVPHILGSAVAPSEGTAEEKAEHVWAIALALAEKHP